MTSDRQGGLIDRLTEDEVLDMIDPPAPGRAQRPIPRGATYPALRLWTQEVRAGYHGQHAGRCTTWRTDALWRAACWQQTARQAERDGDTGLWHHAMRQAREVLTGAVVAKARRSA